MEAHSQCSLLACQHGTVCQVCESLMCAWHFYGTMWPPLPGDSSLSHVCIILTYILRLECIERNLPSRLFLNLMRGGGEGDHLKYGCYGRCMPGLFMAKNIVHLFMCSEMMASVWVFMASMLVVKLLNAKWQVPPTLLIRLEFISPFLGVTVDVTIAGARALHKVSRGSCLI